MIAENGRVGWHDYNSTTIIDVHPQMWGAVTGALIVVLVIVAVNPIYNAS